MATIGEQIRSARKAKGMTQEQLAAILNMSRQGVSHWEQGRTSPDAEMLLRIGRALEYSFEEQHTRPAENAAPETPAISEQLSAMEPLPPPDAIPEEAPAEEPLSPEPVPRPHRRGLWLVCAALLLAVCLLGSFLLLKPQPQKPVVALSFLEDAPVLRYIPSYFEGHGYGWLYTLAIHNESDVPLHPDRVCVLYYSGDRIHAKSVISYEYMREFMDADLLNKEDTPLHLLLATNQLNCTRAECILYATDPDGEQHTYSISTQLLPPEL